MSLMTFPSSGPGGVGRDASDFQRLRHARDQHLGFPVGKFQQSPPMLFTRDGHNVFLGDMYRGHTAFLMCSGPSLATHNLSQLDQRGILTLAVNNAAVVHRPNLWCSVDDPGNFCDAIWYDPGIAKFVPLCHMEKTFMVRDENEVLVPSSHRVGDMPAVFGFRRNEAFVADQWLYEDTFNWGNHGDRVDAYGNKGSRSIMYIALRLLFYLGIRRVYLLGCDFRMQMGKQNYAFEQDRTRSSVRGNNSSYRILNSRLGKLLPFFEREHYQVFNCTPQSGLSVFPHVSFDEAIVAARAIMPKTIITAGMYDRQQKEKDKAQPAAQPPVQKEVTALPPAAETLQTILSDLTVVTAVDESHAHVLRQTWPTWMKFKPELRELPIIVIHDRQFEPQSVLGEVASQSNVRFVPWEMEHAETQRERMLTAFVKVAASDVKTKWYLKLDADVIATHNGPWIDPQWFIADSRGRQPAYVASPWGYTKPANAIAKLDEWGDTIDELRCFPRLGIPYDPESSRVSHPRMASWCFFGNTAWTRAISNYAPGRLPIPSHDTFLSYCAIRRGDHTVQVKMSKYGWETISNFRRLKRRCSEVIQTSSPPSSIPELPRPEMVRNENNGSGTVGVLYLLAGDTHAVRLLVSIASLRNFYNGRVTVIAADERAERICCHIVGDDRLKVQSIRCEDTTIRGRRESYLFKPRLHEVTPYDKTVYLDCDTLIVGDVSPLFDFPDSEHIIATQFSDWKTRGRIVSRRIRAWQDTHPDLVALALEFGPAINTGVFSFTRQTRLFERWHQVARKGKHHFIPDELAMQLLLPAYPHVVLDGRFNCSARFGKPEEQDTRIIHFHGGRHLRWQRDRWLAAYKVALSQNLGGICLWSPAGDASLRAELEKNGPLESSTQLVKIIS